MWLEAILVKIAPGCEVWRWTCSPVRVTASDLVEAMPRAAIDLIPDARAMPVPERISHPRFEKMGFDRIPSTERRSAAPLKSYVPQGGLRAHLPTAVKTSRIGGRHMPMR